MDYKDLKINKCPGCEKEDTVSKINFIDYKDKEAHDDNIHMRVEFSCGYSPDQILKIPMPKATI